MATNKTSVSGTAVYAQQYTPVSDTTKAIPTGMVTDAYGDVGNRTVQSAQSALGYKVQLLPGGDWRWPKDTDWIVTYTSTDTTHRFVLGAQAFSALFA